MSIERFVWKLIKRLVRAERERDRWETRYRHAIESEPAAPQTAELPSGLLAISEYDLMRLDQLSCDLLDLGELLRAVDAQHNLSPILAQEWRLKLETRRETLRSIVEREKKVGHD